MAVCKYFIQGNCKYGSRCRYEHVEYGVHSSRSGDLSGGERQIGLSILKGGNSSFSTYQNRNQSTAVQFAQSPETHSFSHKNTSGSTGLFNVQEVMTMISRDMMQAAKGGQWQLSCYAPSRDLPNVPGLDDYSPEEMRWECYKALSNGALPIWQAMAQQLFNNVTKTYNELEQKEQLYALVDGWLRRNDSFNSSAQNATSPYHGNTATVAPFFNRPNPPSYPVQSSASPAFSFSLPGAKVGTPIQSAGPNLFVNENASLSPVSNPFGGTVVTTSCNDSQAYSNPEDLSEEDCKAFQADRFTMGKIPTKPPTVTFCN